MTKMMSKMTSNIKRINKSCPILNMFPTAKVMNTERFLLQTIIKRIFTHTTLLHISEVYKTGKMIRLTLKIYRGYSVPKVDKHIGRYLHRQYGRHI